MVEDWKHYEKTVNVTFFNIEFDQKDNCKCYDEYEYDRKPILTLFS